MENGLIEFGESRKVSEVHIFNNPQFGEIRTAVTGENPMFCLADICRVLDIRVQDVRKRLDDRGVDSINTPTRNQYGATVVQQMYFVNEKNLYKVIMRSDKPQAEPFQDWVCGEVLPSIRKTGGYIATTAEMTDTEILAKAVLVAQATIEKRNERIKELESDVREKEQQLLDANVQVAELSQEIQTMQPKVNYYDMILNNKSTVLTSQIAQDYGMSAVALNKILYEMRIQHKMNKQWILYAPYIGQGYVQSKPVEITHKDGRVSVKYNSEWTQKGRLFLYDKLKSVGIIPLIE